MHDVKLGDSGEESSMPSATGDNLASGSSSKAGASSRGPDSTDFRSPSTFGSRGAMSFAAAAMAGLGSANGRGYRREGRDRHGRPLSGSTGEPAKLIFSVGGKQLNRHLTIYQAVQRQLVLEEDDEERFTTGDNASGEGSRFWGDIYTITYKKAEGQSDRTVSTGASNAVTAVNSTKSGSSNSITDAQSNRASLLDSILQAELPCELEKSNPTYNILALLRVLEGLNQLAPRLRAQSILDYYAEGKISSLDEMNGISIRVPSEEFINGKLTPKLSRQIQDALALCSGSLPAWTAQLTKACPFLFPFETRRQYFCSTAFGLSRALYRLQQQQGAESHGLMNDREFRVGRLHRQKVRVSRNRILDSAVKVMEMYSSQRAVLEVEYFGEVGTGLGPTLEFYTLLGQELQKAKLEMWRSTSSSLKPSEDVNLNEKSVGKNANSVAGEFVHAPLGLFPRPWPPNSDASDGSKFSKVTEYFRLVGRVMAKALQDGRLLDLPLSPAFFKIVLGQVEYFMFTSFGEMGYISIGGKNDGKDFLFLQNSNQIVGSHDLFQELDLHDVLSFDAELGKVLEELHAIVCRKQCLESVDSDNHDAVADLRFRGACIEDLCLDFTLPGYPDYVMKPGDETVCNFYGGTLGRCLLILLF